jgi:hypothetical protein
MSGPTQVQEYTGSSQPKAWAVFQRHAAEGARLGWQPIDHQWDPSVLRVTYRASMAAQHTRPAWTLWQPSVQADDYASIDHALDSTDRMEVKLALQQVRAQKAEFLRIRMEASDTIEAIRSHDSNQIAEGASKQPTKRPNAKSIWAYQTALQEANRKAMADALWSSTEHLDQANKLIRAVDKVILQLQDRLVDIGPG